MPKGQQWQRGQRSGAAILCAAPAKKYTEIFRPGGGDLDTGVWVSLSLLFSVASEFRIVSSFSQVFLLFCHFDYEKVEDL